MIPAVDPRGRMKKRNFLQFSKTTKFFFKFLLIFKQNIVAINLLEVRSSDLQGFKNCSFCKEVVY